MTAREAAEGLRDAFASYAVERIAQAIAAALAVLDAQAEREALVALGDPRMSSRATEGELRGTIANLQRLVESQREASVIQAERQAELLRQVEEARGMVARARCGCLAADCPVHGAFGNELDVIAGWGK